MKELMLVLACAQKISIIDVKEGTDNKSEITVVVECDSDTENVQNIIQQHSKTHPVWKISPTTYNVVHVPHITEDNSIYILYLMGGTSSIRKFNSEGEEEKFEEENYATGMNPSALTDSSLISDNNGNLY